MSVKYDAYKQQILELEKQGYKPEQIIQDYVDRNPDKFDKVQKLINEGTDINDLAHAIVYKESKPNLIKETTSAFMGGANETLALLDALVGNVTGSLQNRVFICLQLY